MNTNKDALDEACAEDDLGARNACKLCTPLGACLAFRGVEGCIPFLHGSQGCSTYIRRYLISHFREPLDIASSNFHEEAAIFGGKSNLKAGLDNVSRQYKPSVVGLATTCLAETIGEDMPGLVRDYEKNAPDTGMRIVHVSTASYRGTHIDGFHAAVAELVAQLAQPCEQTVRINLFPGMVSPADLRHLKEIFAAFGLQLALLPDYSETMDGATWSEYQPLQGGGTTVAEIAAMGGSRASIEFGSVLPARSAGAILAEKFSVPNHRLPWPVGMKATDRLLALLAGLAASPVPEALAKERGRLLDAYIDGHKILFGKRAVIYGEEDFVIGLAGFLCEIGVTPVLCATGGRSGKFAEALRAAVPELPADAVVRDKCDFATVAELAPDLGPDFLLGNSKGYSLARKLDIPIIRVGFPIHDRIGAQRLHTLGYRGAQELFDRVVNALLERKQEKSHVGYSYL
jgi:nitrogenase molybdenum-iron protein NifN